MSQGSKDKSESKESTGQDQQVEPSSTSSSRSSSFSSSISFLKLDEIESYEPPHDNHAKSHHIINSGKIRDLKDSKMNSMPVESDQKTEISQVLADKQQSLPVDIAANTLDKENQQQQPQISSGSNSKEADVEPSNTSGNEDFQIVDMLTEEQQSDKKQQDEARQDQRATLASIPNQNLSQLGDSLIDMILNLKTENQKLVRALETNNEFVKDKIEEFKRATEDSKRREAQYAMDKSEHEHQVRKLQRQNLVLSERLKSMETKLKDLKLEANDGLMMAGSSKASSVKNDDQQQQNLYPELNHSENFSLNQAATMQVDATSGEFNINNDQEALAGAKPTLISVTSAGDEQLDGHLNIETQDELLRQCNELEKQLNNIERRDLEICLLQQKLNIFKKNLGTKKMNNFEAKGQIELLKTEIDGLCQERKRQGQSERQANHLDDEAGPSSKYAATAQAIDAAGKLGFHLSKRATRSAVKAAKQASKQAYRGQKAAAVAAAAAAAAAAAVNSGIYSGSSCYSAQRHQQYNQTPVVDAESKIDQQTHRQQYHEQPLHHHAHHRRHHSNHPHLSSLHKLKTEVVNDLMSTANKAMLTGYKVASTHVNLALDKLSQLEQTQAQNLAKNQKPNAGAENLHVYYNLDKNSLD